MKLALLLLSSLLYGRLAAFLFRRFTDSAALRIATNRMLAHILEFRLFIDEPRLIFRAQLDLLQANATVLRILAIPALLCLAIFATAWLPLDRYLDTGQLNAGEVTIAKAQTAAPGVELLAPFGVQVETPPLRIEAEKVTIWRVRTLSPITAPFRTKPGGIEVTADTQPSVYLGLPWWALFAIISTAVSAADFAVFSSSRQIRVR